jgi:hypothetical protein
VSIKWAWRGSGDRGGVDLASHCHIMNAGTLVPPLRTQCHKLPPLTLVKEDTPTSAPLMHHHTLWIPCHTATAHRCTATGWNPNSLRHKIAQPLNSLCSNNLAKGTANGTTSQSTPAPPQHTQCSLCRMRPAHKHTGAGLHTSKRWGYPMGHCREGIEWRRRGWIWRPCGD